MYIYFFKLWAFVGYFSWTR